MRIKIQEILFESVICQIIFFNLSNIINKNFSILKKNKNKIFLKIINVGLKFARLKFL